MLAKHGYFLRVFELKNNFCHLALKNIKKQNSVRQLSSSINEKCNGFHVISTEYSKKLSKKLSQSILLMSQSNHQKKKIQSDFSQDISKSYRNSCGDAKKL